MATNPIAVPLTFGSSGPLPTPPATLRSDIEQSVSAVQPGYTADLPGTLIEDLLSTEMGAVVTIDQARAEAIANATPYLAAPYILAKLGAQFGVPQGLAQNTSVLMVFSGPAGFVIPAGTQVSDGTYTYVLQAPGAIVAGGGSSTPSECVATVNGTFAPAAGTVTTLLTAFPQAITCTNPAAGTPGTTAQTSESYRAQLLGLYQASAQSLVSYTESQLDMVPGVNNLQVDVLQVSGGWEIIVGGGDQYAVALAIFNSVSDLSTLQGASGIGTTVTTTITNGANSYTVTFVQPAAQVVTCAVEWNTNLPNFTAGAQVDSLAATAVLNYFNSITVGQPINLNVLNSIFVNAVSSLIAEANISALSYAITINGTDATPSSGTQIILSAAEGYFSAVASGITVTQG